MSAEANEYGYVWIQGVTERCCDVIDHEVHEQWNLQLISSIKSQRVVDVFPLLSKPVHRVHVRSAYELNSIVLLSLIIEVN